MGSGLRASEGVGLMLAKPAASGSAGLTPLKQVEDLGVQSFWGLGLRVQGVKGVGPTSAFKIGRPKTLNPKPPGASAR